MSKLADNSGDRGKLDRVRGNAMSFETKNKPKFCVRVSKVSGWNRVTVIGWSRHNTRLQTYEPHGHRTCVLFCAVRVGRLPSVPRPRFNGHPISRLVLTGQIWKRVTFRQRARPLVYNRGEAVTTHVFEFRLLCVRVSGRTAPLNSYAQWRRTGTSISN